MQQIRPFFVGYKKALSFTFLYSSRGTVIKFTRRLVRPVFFSFTEVLEKRIRKPSEEAIVSAVIRREVGEGGREGETPQVDSG